MNVIQANCKKCSNREKFKYLGNNSYKCMSCNNIAHKCKSEECNNMINYGTFCLHCIGNGFKRGGALAITGVVGIVATAIGIRRFK